MRPKTCKVEYDNQGMLNMMIKMRKLNMMVMIRKLMMIIMTIRRNPAPFEALDLQNRHLAIGRE